MEDKLTVICDNLSKNPYCPHGPTLLFKKQSADGQIIEEYFSCSAYRSFKDCKFYLKKSDYEKDESKQFSKNQLHFDPQLAVKLRIKIHSKKPEKRCYCHTCNILFKERHIDLHREHTILEGISDELFRYPTRVLQPLNNNKAEAQYFFNKSTLEFFGNCISKLGIRKVICIGAPRLHEYLKSKQKQLEIDTFLLDLDYRFFYFLEYNEFGWFNMFNNHFFEGNQKIEIFENFLKCNSDESVLLVTDPPFGCRTEPLVNTIKEIAATYQRVNSCFKILPVFWIFPYFMENYIKMYMPEMEMIDYKINYINHDLYHDRLKGRKQGSPVRLFTNISPNLIELPLSEGYKFCEECNRWTSIENIHCDICKECCSKNGESYRHCILCATCVKPNYLHCNNCGRCTQRDNHSCMKYQSNLHCWICKERGHTELNCQNWIRLSKQYKIHRNIVRLAATATKKGCRLCLVCCKIGHNEKNCPKRKSILKEKCFLNTTENIFSRNKRNLC